MTSPISMKMRIGLGMLLAYGGTAWLHGVNAATTSHDGRTGTSFLRFLRDGTLSLFLVLPAVLLVLALTARWGPASRVIAVVRTTAAVVGVTTAVFMTGAMGHAVVFASEHAPSAQVAAAGSIIRVGTNPIMAAPSSPAPTVPKPGFQVHKASPGWMANMTSDTAGPHDTHSGVAAAVPTAPGMTAAGTTAPGMTAAGTTAPGTTAAGTTAAGTTAPGTTAPGMSVAGMTAGETTAAGAPASSRFSAGAHQAPASGHEASMGGAHQIPALHSAAGPQEATSWSAVLRHGLEGGRVFPMLLLLVLVSLIIVTRPRDDDDIPQLSVLGRRARSAVPLARRYPRRVVATAMGGTIAVMAAILTATPVATALVTPATEANGVCPAGARAIEYDLAAFQQVIPLNGWGDKLADGLMYGLKNADARINKDAIVANPNLTQPLVVRANVGDCISLKVRNDITDRRIGLSTQGLVQLDVKTSDGARVGNNPDTTIATGGERTYTWYADQEGQAPLYDNANLDPDASKHTSIQLGLYGAVIVHPKGATWHNQVTGADLLTDGRAVETQVFADVHAGTESTRSAVMVVGDENEDVRDRKGKVPTYPTTGLKDSTFGINYRSEPLRNRLRAIQEHRGTVTPENPRGVARTITLPNGTRYSPRDHFCDGYAPELKKVVADPGARCLSEESHLQSWVFGDEGKLTRTVHGKKVTDTDNLIPKGYVSDPLKFHVVHPGAMETHPWHQHTQRWNADPKNPKSPLNDVQSFGPGEARELKIEGGAGGTQRTAGDSIFHCHLYPHFAQGFWGHLRIFDKLRDGSKKYPDGTPLQALKELPSRIGATAAATDKVPGFPLFVKGDVGQRAYRPPNSVVKDTFASLRRPGDAPRGPNALEAAGMPALNKAKPGAGYIDPCPASAPTRVYRPHVIDTPIPYNSAGWKDKQGRIYVEEADAVAVRTGRKAPEPYTIRSRVGDCVQLFTTNDLHLDENARTPLDHVNRLDGVFMGSEETSEVSTHVHLVKFDEVTSDGTSVGWNYTSSAMPGQTFGYRWFVDTALRTVFFHDHQYANLHQQKGLYAAMNVEPVDATWHDPKTGKATNGVGPIADIRSATGPDFREMTLFYGDRAPMWRNNGKGPAISPPSAPDNFGQDQGGYSVNYRNAPFQERTKAGAPGKKSDPAYTYSSAVHKDPDTPILRAYENDPVVIRNVVGAHEEMHEFTLHGHRWLNEPDNPLSTTVDTQSLALAEYFNYELQGSTVVKTAPGAEATVKKALNNELNGTPSIVRGGAGSAGDYLYGSPLLEDQWMGMWGLFRVPGARVSDLQPLPDRSSPGRGNPWPALTPGDVTRKASTKEVAATTPCPSVSKVVPFNVSAIAKDIVYNPTAGDHDPYGLMYVRTEDVAKVHAGEIKAEPLVIRANVGECVKVTLRNQLPLTPAVHTGDLPLPADVAGFPRSNRASMHPSLLSYNVTSSDGATVGYNFDQTVAPGESMTYTWYAQPGIGDGAVNLLDFGDRRGSRHHGLYGSLMVEPAGSTVVDPTSGGPVTSGAQANVTWRDAAGITHPFREFVLNVADGLILRDKEGRVLPYADEGEPGDTGHRGINYRTERFAPRVATDPEVANVMSSVVHGDPATPVLRAYVGDETHVRVVSGGDRDRAHTFTMNGHSWRYQPKDPSSMVRYTQGGLLTGGAFNMDLIGGAGGRQGMPGDYLYRDGGLVNQTNQGLWGIFRVEGSPQADLLPLQ
jgi:manganese oxidase